MIKRQVFQYPMLVSPMADPEAGRVITAPKEKQNRVELKCFLGQTHGFRENFRFNPIIINDVTIIFYNKSCACGEIVVGEIEK